MIDLETIDDDVVGALCERVRRAGLTLVLLRVAIDRPTQTFMAVILDPAPFGHASMVNLGAGTQLSPTVAAVRATTEAAQSRLTFIHGSREDLPEQAYRGGRPRADLTAFFSGLVPDTQWSELDDHASTNLAEDLAQALATLRALRLHDTFAVDLSQPGTDIYVAKMLVPSARCPTWI